MLEDDCGFRAWAQCDSAMEPAILMGDGDDAGVSLGFRNSAQQYLHGQIGCAVIPRTDFDEHSWKSGHRIFSGPISNRRRAGVSLPTPRPPPHSGLFHVFAGLRAFRRVIAMPLLSL